MVPAMKNPILRILAFVILLSLIAGIVIAVIGYLLGWETSIQYSDGFFWAGLILISFGFISFQGYRQRVGDWPPVGLSPDERAHLLDADILRG
jgi:hypothetical protein